MFVNNTCMGASGGSIQMYRWIGFCHITHGGHDVMNIVTIFKYPCRKATASKEASKQTDRQAGRRTSCERAIIPR